MGQQQKEELYKKLQKYRDEKGLKNTDIAKALDVTDVTVSNWMNGKSVPKLGNLHSLAKLFEVPLGALNGMSEENEQEINQLYNKIAALQSEVSQRNEIVNKLTEITVKLDEDQKFQGTVLVLVIGVVLMVLALIFKEGFSKPPTVSQGLLFLGLVFTGFIFFVIAVVLILFRRIKKDIHSTKKDADSD